MNRLVSQRTALAIVGITLGAVCSITDARADNFSFTGNFAHDDDVQTFNFNVGASSTVTLLTYSYAGSAGQSLFGGTNSAGVVIPRGGFDAILALFDSTGANAEPNCGDDAMDPITNLSIFSPVRPFPCQY